MNAHDPHHWTLNSCFGAFLSVWVHLEPFCYYTKLAAKRAKLVQLMQKFVPRCLVRIFCNEHSWSTQLYPKLMFWCVSFRLGAFVTVSLLHETWCKTRQTCAINVKVQFFTTNAHDTHHWTLNSWFGGFFPFGCIWDHFAIARKCAKLVQLMQKFLPRCLVRIFRNERSWSTPMEPKLMFWCISICLGALGTVSLLHETCCKTCQIGAINAKVCATKSSRNFSQRTLPIHTIRP